MTMPKNYSEEAILKRRSYTRKWQQNNPEMVLQRKRDWLKNPINRIKHCLYGAKARAKNKNIEFNVCIDDLLPLPTHCPILGIELNYEGTQGKGFFNDSPSIDRIDSTKGYIKGNVMIISWRANRIKADSTVEELRKLLTYMETKQ